MNTTFLEWCYNNESGANVNLRLCSLIFCESVGTPYSTPSVLYKKGEREGSWGYLRGVGSGRKVGKRQGVEFTKRGKFFRQKHTDTHTYIHTSRYLFLWIKAQILFQNKIFPFWIILEDRSWNFLLNIKISFFLKNLISYKTIHYENTKKIVIFVLIKWRNKIGQRKYFYEN